MLVKFMNLTKGLVGLSYPVLGNLSRNIQERLEGNIYNPLIATATSIITNLPVHAYLMWKGFEKACELSNPSNGQLLYETLIASSVIFLGETIVRSINLFEREIVCYPPGTICVFDISDREPTGSLIGKLISLPFERHLKKKHPELYSD